MRPRGRLVVFIRQLLSLAAVIWLVTSLSCGDSRKPTLSGRVLDCMTGGPISEAFVSVSRYGRSISTTRSGHYRFFDLPAGTCLVVAEGYDYRPDSEFVILSSREVKYLHFALEPYGNSETGICGLLWDDSTGELLPYVGISLFEERWKTYTNTDGYFRFLNLEPGTLFCDIHRIGGPRIRSIVRLEEMDMYTLRLGLRGGPEKWVCASETDGCAISGRITDALTGEAVRSAQVGMSGWDLAFLSDSNGFYCIDMLPQRSCTLKVKKKGDFEDAVVTVPLRGQALEVNVGLIPETGALRGIVVDGGSGLACPASLVECTRQGHRQLEWRCSEAGAFSFEDLPIGPWRIRASRPGYETSVTDSLLVGTDATTFVGLELERLEDVRSGGEVTAGEARNEIHGYVSWAGTGLSLAGANIWIDELRIGAVSDASGYYRISNVPPGKHILQARSLGFEDFTIEVDIKPAQSKRIDIALEEIAIELDGIIHSR